MSIYRLHHANMPLHAADAYHVGGKGNYDTLDEAIKAAQALDALGPDWDMDVIEESDGNRCVVWGWSTTKWAQR